MVKEATPITYHQHYDRKQKQPAGQIVVTQDLQPDTRKNKPKVAPSDLPDQLLDMQLIEQLQEELAIADSFVDAALENPLIRERVTEMREKLPKNGDHEVRVGRMAASLAVHYELSDDERYIAAAAGLTHDDGKLRIPLDWENLSWETAYFDDNKDLVEAHPLNGAECMRTIDSRLEIPVALHHAFKGGNAYPKLGKYFGDKEMPDLTVARMIALADMTEAMITRRRSEGKPVTDEEVRALLSTRTYKDPQGREQQSFSDDEITTALLIYHLIDATESQKV